MGPYREQPDNTSVYRAGFLMIPAGRFVMGALLEDEAIESVHRHRQEVTISRPFLLSVTPVKQAEFEEVLLRNPSHFRGADRPVEMLSWYEAVLYCNQLSQIDGLEQAYVLENPRGKPWEDAFRADVRWRGLGSPGYRLPTEAEWEYACRAGTETSQYGDLHEIAWGQENSNGSTHPVGLKQANDFGLHDMLGNVWEWCNDWLDAYASGPVTDPTGPDRGSYRTVRGGSFANSDQFLSAIRRRCDPPGYRNNCCGFRVARSLP